VLLDIAFTETDPNHGEECTLHDVEANAHSIGRAAVLRIPVNICFKNLTGFLLGTRQTLLETFDAGKTWTPRNIDAAKDEVGNVMRLKP
jgi:photosystem II stability/assembly factor-like uncharacterized protein